ncbi:helix-turn-helix domain-containing protein [Synechocystis sp. PCC 7509]|uniref:helix-turn-helix domain-containing protein n=1 Tax=Synechocystis sp. PCC 7509 TaxID=927677 RepID=UPI0002AC50A8|nr:helix-turn-helix transcriptional regulator [Synechocystis sp. PCC 7509]
MIKNERQYRITKAQAQKFQQALTKLTEYSEEAKQVNPLLWQAKKSAIESQLNELQEEIKEYERLAKSSSSKSIALAGGSIEALPKALIEARIAAKISQKELAARLGIKEQQIQRYEATNYASVKLSRVIEVSQALDIKLPSIRRMVIAKSKKLPSKRLERSV